MMSGQARQKVHFVLSVDTEEEFDWNGDFPQENCSVANIRCLPQFHEFCSGLGVRPTYLVDYPVAAQPDSAAIMKAIHETGQAEIGAHLHPWCTPPFVGTNSERESHVVNLPPWLVHQKLEALIEVIQRNIGVTPRAFRTGRWGINSAVLQVVKALGFDVDSSVYPYYANEYFSCLDVPDKPYWPDLENPDVAGAQRAIFELPVTAGFNRSGFPFWGQLHRAISAPGMRLLRPVGVAWRTGLLRKLYLSPELAETADMKALVSSALKDGHQVIHMFLHSSTLLPGHNAYIGDHSARDDLYGSIAEVVAALAEQADIAFATLSEAAHSVQLQAG